LIFSLSLHDALPILLILDEVHRLDKAKQDFLLPHLENNLFTMIGCTTSNPYHSINPAIRSRTHLFELEALKPEDISIVVKRALTDRKSTRLNSSHVS